jgi:hypothetical protein
MLRRSILVFVIALFVLLVAFAVLVGGYALASATDDADGATVLWWIAMSCLMGIVMDVLLLVGALGIAVVLQLEQRERASQ